MRFSYALLCGGLILSSCTPTSFPEQQVGDNRCGDGAQSFDMFIELPAEYGTIQALTQFENGRDGLISICRLLDGQGTYPGYSGEVSNGNAGICVSARTSAAGHVLSCASASEVRRAIDASFGTRADVIEFTRWQPFPEPL